MTVVSPEQLTPPLADPIDESARHSALISAARRRARRDTAQVWALRFAIIAAALGMWWGASEYELVRPTYISNPASVAKYLIEAVQDGEFWEDARATVDATLLGLGIGGVLGVISGLVLAGLPLLRRATQPIITFSNALPRAALAPIFLVWFGLTVWSKVAVSASTVYFVMLLNTVAGVDSVGQDHHVLGRSLRMSRLQVFRLIQIPAAGPAIVAGLRLATVYSVLGVVVSEMVASRSGLGVRLVYATNSYNIAGAFGVIVALATLAVILDWMVTLVERRMRWDPSSRS